MQVRVRPRAALLTWTTRNAAAAPSVAAREMEARELASVIGTDRWRDTTRGVVVDGRAGCGRTAVLVVRDCSGDRQARAERRRRPRARPQPPAYVARATRGCGGLGDRGFDVVGSGLIVASMRPRCDPSRELGWTRSGVRCEPIRCRHLAPSGAKTARRGRRSSRPWARQLDGRGNWTGADETVVVSRPTLGVSRPNPVVSRPTLRFAPDLLNRISRRRRGGEGGHRGGRAWPRRLRWHRAGGWRCRPPSRRCLPCRRPSRRRRA